MKVTAERIPESQMLLEIELEEERVRRSLDQAARRLSQRFRIPGFRKGKAPRAVVERALSVDAVFEEAAERMVPQAVQEALESEGLEPVAPPSVEIASREPLTLRATVPLPPTVELGDYRGIAVARPESEYSEEAVEERILNLRRNYAVLQPVERPPQLYDRLTADLRAVVDGEEILNETGAEFPLREGEHIGVPGLIEQLVGIEAGVQHQIDVDVDEDWDDDEVAGKTVTFEVTIHEVKEEELPDPDDDFAMEVSDEFETFAELRGQIAEQLRERADQQVQQQLRSAVLQAAIARATLEYPPALVEHEVEHMRQDFARQMGQDPATFLRDESEQGEQLLATFRTQANERVINTLVLQHVTEAEQITVTDEEIEAELEQMLSGVAEAEAPVEAVRDQIRENIRGSMTRERTVERLEQIALANHAANQAAGVGAGDDDADGEGGAEAGAPDDGAAAAEAPAAETETEPAQTGEPDQPEASEEA